MPPKRKRGNTNSSTVPAKVDVAQPSSRDASEEDATDAILQEVKQRAAESNPPAKRTRSKIDTSNQKGADTSDADLGDSDDERPTKKQALRDLVENGEGGEKGHMKMEEPPKAGLVDPVGYHTNPPPKGRPVRVYADGVFDLFHLGHMRQLQQAKTAFPNTHLMVGVTGNKETHKRKGLTVLSGEERAESIRHCKWVDEVIEDCPWVVTTEFIEQHKIDFVAHDDLPYGAAEGDDIYAPIKKQGKFLVTQRTEGVSTTGIITKIVRDYDQYISRQLKRGTPRQELNVSWLKKHEIDIKRNITELRDNIRSNWSTTGQELGRDFRSFWSRPSSPSRGREGDATGSPRVAGASSPSLISHLSHLDIPRPSSGQNPDSFAAGYSLGLAGSVKAWMSRNRRNLNESRGESLSDEDAGDKSSEDDSPRGRTGKLELGSEPMDTMR